MLWEPGVVGSSPTPRLHIGRWSSGKDDRHQQNSLAKEYSATLDDPNSIIGGSNPSLPVKGTNSNFTYLCWRNKEFKCLA